MVISFKDAAKFFGIAIMACCAVFVCALFLNYNVDLSAIKGSVGTPEAVVMYDAQVSMGKVTCSVSGGCLALTSVVMLVFYIKNYIDANGRHLGILKAMGYSDFKIAVHFCIFGFTVFAGCLVGFIGAHCYMPKFYELQGALFPELSLNFHPLLAFFLVIFPSVFFAALAVVFALIRLSRPVLNLLKEQRATKIKIGRAEEKERSFLDELRLCTLKSKKALVFFIVFSAFCYSAMVQMSLSMKKYASEEMGVIILVIGLILAAVTLLIALTSVIKGNSKTVCMMRVFGYSQREIRGYILNGYRPFALIGFLIGTFYQYALLKIMIAVVFADIENIEYSFSFPALAVTLLTFVFLYEAVIRAFSFQLNKISLKQIMME